MAFSLGDFRPPFPATLPSINSDKAVDAHQSGLTGSIGAIHANRLSTSLHTNLHPQSKHPRPNRGLQPFQRAITLYLIAFPCEALFLGFVHWAGWIDLSLGWAGWVCFALIVSILFPFLPVFCLLLVDCYFLDYLASPDSVLLVERSRSRVSLQPSSA